MRASDCSMVVVCLAVALGGCPEDIGGFGSGGGDDPGDRAPDGRADAPVPEPEECGNGLDEDLDGAPDDECDCAPGTEQPCFPGQGPVQGACEMGVQRCEEHFEFGAWGACVGATGPEEDVCNDGIDQDCDGRDATCGEDPPCDGLEVACPGEDVFTIGETPNARPIDIVWVVDQSGSMDDEIAQVRANLNGFAEAIADSGLDHHVMLVANRDEDRDDHAVCIPEPLAGPDCADGERFRQIDDHIDSNDALEKIEDHIDEIEAFLRPGSLRVFTVVTDDESDESAAAFNGFLLDRAGYEDWVFSGFVGIDEDVCDDIADEGRVYVELAALTRGAVEDICAPDWGLALDAWAEDLGTRTLVFELSDDPAGIRSVEVDRGAGWVALPDDAWDFEPPRTIRLSPDAGWSEGDRVRVAYD